MKRLVPGLALALALFGILGLAACSGDAAPKTPIILTPKGALETAASVTVKVASPTPNIVNTPYPGSDGEAPTSIVEPTLSDGAYPLPGSESPTPTDSAYPVPATVAPPGVPVSTATPVPTRLVLPTGGTPATLTPAPIVHTELEATDPATVQLSSGRTQLVEFFAFWSPICRSMAPVMNGLEEKYQGRINFVFLDVDDPVNEAFKKALGYQYPPNFFLLDGQGNILQQWLGYVPVEEFETAFATVP